MPWGHCAVGRRGHVLVHDGLKSTCRARRLPCLKCDTQCRPMARAPPTRGRLASRAVKRKWVVLAVAVAAWLGLDATVGVAGRNSALTAAADAASNAVGAVTDAASAAAVAAGSLQAVNDSVPIMNITGGTFVPSAPVFNSHSPTLLRLVWVRRACRHVSLQLAPRASLCVPCTATRGL